LSPPLNKPALKSVPVVPSFVELVVKKEPFTVPELVMLKVKLELRDLEPPDADDQAVVGRALWLYVGALAFPASVQPA
jgi:hypothetical protein